MKNLILEGRNAQFEDKNCNAAGQESFIIIFLTKSLL
jgi:hypothetical protein